MATIENLNKSITSMDKIELFDFIKAIRTRRAVIIPNEKTNAKSKSLKTPKTNNVKTLAKSLSAEDKRSLTKLLKELNQ